MVKTSQSSRRKGARSKIGMSSFEWYALFAGDFILMADRLVCVILEAPCECAIADAEMLSV